MSTGNNCAEIQRIEYTQSLIALVMVVMLVLLLIAPNFFSSEVEFDPDPPTIEVFRDGKQYAFMFSWDDDRLDLEFSYLEDELDFKHTSFVVTGRMQSRRLWGLDMLFRGHDIQSHSKFHLHHARLNSSYRDYLFNQSVIDIESLYGYSPIILAYPFGSSNSQCEQQVLNYFKVARGISHENDSTRGTWPITRAGNCKHSFPSIHGVRGSNMRNLISSFERMISGSDGGYRAYKCYGHTSWFTEEERASFFSLLEGIAFRDDTWYTTWGEALAYQIQRDTAIIDLFTYNQSRISFRTSVSYDSNYGIGMTYRVEIPDTWKSISVVDDGRISDYSEIIKKGNKTFILLDSVPRGQIIEILSIGMLDTVGPEISNFRTMRTDEGVAFLADVYDQRGYVSDVNITVTNGLETYSFYEVYNPTFWSNSTYGRVMFDIPEGCYNFKVTASDSSQNVATSSRCIYVN